MKLLFRATAPFMTAMRRDLMRKHPFAYERIGFVTVRAAASAGHLVLLAQDYHPVADEDYIDDPRVGARIGQEALRKALNLALLNPVGVFHVHMHMLPFAGRLWFSHVDLTEQRNYVPDFFKVRATMPHGAIVLSPDAEAGLAWVNAQDIAPIAEFHTVGSRMKVIRAANDGSTDFYG